MHSRLQTNRRRNQEKEEEEDNSQFEATPRFSGFSDQTGRMGYKFTEDIFTLEEGEREYQTQSSQQSEDQNQQIDWPEDE